MEAKLRTSSEMFLFRSVLSNLLTPSTPVSQQRSGALAWEAAPGGSAGLFIPDLVFSSLLTHRSQDLAPPSGLGKRRETRASPPPTPSQPYLPYLPGYSECSYSLPSSLLVPGSLGPWFPLALSLQAGSQDQHTPAAPI